MMERRGFHDIIVYLDDFLVIAPTKEECERAYHALLQLLLHHQPEETSAPHAMPHLPRHPAQHCHSGDDTATHETGGAPVTSLPVPAKGPGYKARTPTPGGETQLGLPGRSWWTDLLKTGDRPNQSSDQTKREIPAHSGFPLGPWLVGRLSCTLQWEMPFPRQPPSGRCTDRCLSCRSRGMVPGRLVLLQLPNGRCRTTPCPAHQPQGDPRHHFGSQALVCQLDEHSRHYPNGQPSCSTHHKQRLHITPRHHARTPLSLLAISTAQLPHHCRIPSWHSE